MKTIIRKIDAGQPDPAIIDEAGRILRRGGLVAFPTETVYGLGADALCESASAKIYAAKGRPSDNPLIVHIAEYAALSAIAAEAPPEAEKLAAAFWPGPLTMIFKKTDRVPRATTGGLDTVAVRMPDHAAALAVIRAGGGYIAAPSANISGRPSPTRAEHVAEDLNGRIDMIVDGGPVGIGLESTIVDMSNGKPMILRPGYITPEMLAPIVGEVPLDPAITGGRGFTGAPKAPGMKYRHYAPRGDLAVVEGAPENVCALINRMAAECLADGYTVGIIATEESKGLYPLGIVKSVGTRRRGETIAANLYAALREFDELGADYIFSEAFDDEGIGRAVMNRLLKAAGQKTIDADAADPIILRKNGKKNE